MNRKIQIVSLAVFLFFFIGFPKAFSQCFELVWSEEFNYTGFPDSKIWNMEVGNNGGANNEKQYYTQNDKDNCWVENGSLVITGLKENLGGQAYTSARINTRGKAEFMYVKIEARTKLPYGQGIWPAFWTLGANIGEVGWPKCGEMDIMELIGGSGARDRTTYGTNHWANASGAHAYQGGNKSLPSGKFADDFHVFSYVWNKTTAYWYLDGVQFYTMNISSSVMSEFHQKYFIILNLAVGGDWPGVPDGTTVFPQKFEIDYVRVYQLADADEMQGKDTVVANEKEISYDLKPLEGRTFQWTVPDGVALLSKADSSAVVVDWGCNPGEISCTVTAPCSSYIFKKNVSVQSPEIAGPLFFDKVAGNLLFSLPVMNETDYLWTVPSDASVITGETSSSAEVLWGQASGEVSVQITNSCLTQTISKKIYKYGKHPYPDPETPFLIPGTISATNYDYGGEGVSYHDTAPASNQGTGGPREDEGVDTETQPLFTNVGYISAGEWLEYTIKVPAEGYYRIEMKVASLNTTAMGPIRVLVNGEARVNDIPVAGTGAWTTFVTHSQRLLYLYETDTILRILAVKGGFNLGPITLTVDNSVSAEENRSSGKHMGLFPNPVSSKLHVNLRHEKPGDIYFRFLDVSGKLMFSEVYKNAGSGEQQFAFSGRIKDLRSGVYFIEVTTQDQIYFSKFIKD